MPAGGCGLWRNLHSCSPKAGSLNAPLTLCGGSEGGIVGWRDFIPGFRSFGNRVVSTYVLDLLSEKDIRQAVFEAHCTLTANGKLCLASLTEGNAFASRVVSRLWATLFRTCALLVGGCRPVRLESFIDRQNWVVKYVNVFTRFGGASEVLIASPLHASESDVAI